MPGSGPPGTVVTITGSTFIGTTNVTFNGTGASYVVDNDTQITATVPGGATTGPLSVTNIVGTSVSGTAFVVTNAPSISSFTPTSGPVGSVVTITGQNFNGAPSRGGRVTAVGLPLAVSAVSGCVPV